MLDSNNRQFSGILPSAPPEPALLPPAPEPAPQKCQASGASEPCLCRWWQFRASVAFSVLRGLYFTELSTYLTYEQGPCIGLLVYILPATKPAIMTNLAYPRAIKYAERTCRARYRLGEGQVAKKDSVAEGKRG